MTFLELQNDVLERLNLPLDLESSARDRVKRYLNEGYRLVLGDVGMSKARDGQTTLDTVAGQAEYTVDDCHRIRFIVDPDNDQRLDEVTIGQIRSWDPGNDYSGQPLAYAVRQQGHSSVTIRLYPIPSNVRTLHLDITQTANPMSGDTNRPAWPEEFHSLLVHYALAQEFQKMDDTRYSDAMRMFDHQLRALRFALRKSDTRAIGQRMRPAIRHSVLGPQFPEG